MEVPLYDLNSWRAQVLKRLGAQTLFFTETHPDANPFREDPAAAEANQEPAPPLPHTLPVVTQYYAHQRKHFHDSLMEKVRKREREMQERDLRLLQEQNAQYVELLRRFKDEKQRQTSQPDAHRRALGPDAMQSPKSVRRKSNVRIADSASTIGSTQLTTESPTSKRNSSVTFKPSPLLQSSSSDGVCYDRKSFTSTVRSAQQILQEVSLYSDTTR